MQREKFFYVYMVADRSRVLYVGFTSDLFQSVLQHMDAADLFGLNGMAERKKRLHERSRLSDGVE